jgi:hypothetical protein
MYNIEMDLREIRWGGLHWIYLALNRGQWKVIVNTVVNIPVLRLCHCSIVDIVV